MGNKKTIAGGIVASALVIAIPFIKRHEGESLVSYKDVVGVWTICNGEAHVKPGEVMMQKQCDDLTKTTIGQYMSSVAALIHVPISPATLAAHTSFAYNIGLGGWDQEHQRWTGYKGSSALRLTNNNQLAEGCSAMSKWTTAGGKDCHNKKNNCYGVVQRREDEIKLCLAGLN